MSARLQLAMIGSIHFFLSLSGLSKQPTALSLTAYIASLLASCFYFYRFGRELYVLLQGDVLWQLYTLQITLILLAFFTQPSLFILCSVGMFSAEWLRWTMLNQRVEKRSIARLEGAYKQQKEAFQRLRVQRHDFLKHANTMQHLLDGEHYEELRLYFTQLIGEYKNVNNAIQGEDSHMAAVLLHYQNEAMKHQLQLQYELTAQLSQLPLKTTDQVALLTNLLANSLEAASLYVKEGKQAAISVTTSKYSGIFILEVKNDTPPLPKELADSLFQQFERSTKGEEHEGLGTYIIAKIVKQHGGTLRYTYEAPLLSIKIKLPIVEGNGQ